MTLTFSESSVSHEHPWIYLLGNRVCIVYLLPLGREKKIPTGVRPTKGQEIGTRGGHKTQTRCPFRIPEAFAKRTVVIFLLKSKVTSQGLKT